MAPGAAQGTALEKDRGADARPVFGGHAHDLENGGLIDVLVFLHSFFIQKKVKGVLPKF
jgi:hypothetical protein